MSPEKAAAIVQDYRDGVTWGEIARRHDTHPQAIRQALAGAGISANRRPPRTWPKPNLDMLEDAEWMADDGMNLTGVLARLGVKPDTFYVACRRHGRTDLYWRLVDREPDAEWRRKCGSRPRDERPEMRAS